MDCVFQIGNCKNVTVMSLRSNKLEFLPDEIGQMTKLRVLNLSDNRYKHTTTHAETHADTRRQHFLNGRFGSVSCSLTACSHHRNGWVCCHGYVLCRLYSAWAEEASLFSSSPLRLSLFLSLCLSQVEEPTVYLHQAEGPGSFVAFWQSGISLSLSSLHAYTETVECSARTQRYRYNNQITGPFGCIMFFYSVSIPI